MSSLKFCQSIVLCIDLYIIWFVLGNWPKSVKGYAILRWDAIIHNAWSQRQPRARKFLWISVPGLFEFLTWSCHFTQYVPRLVKYNKMSFHHWQHFSCLSKVEKILKGSLESIPSPSPSVKIQIMSGKVCLRCEGKTLLGIVNKFLKTKSLLTSPSNVLPYYLT